MSQETGPGRESYLTGGNLLNEQDRIARGKEHVEQSVPGAAIPEQHADSITEEQHTEGGGSVPPGSAEAGHTVRRNW
ncbi:hypothetical protein [Arthrobacter pigmenti]